MTRHITRHAVCQALIAVVLVSGLTRPASAEVTKFVSNNAWAWFDMFDGSCAWTYLNVARYGTPDSIHTYINYSVYDVCVGDSIVYGSGEIENADFKVSSKRAKLQTDLNYDPNFYSIGVLGRVEVVWNIDKSISERFDGRYESRRPEQRLRQRGSWESKAAAATGSMIGLAVEGMAGGVGNSHDVSVEIIR
jgi:hypothetical protein